MDAKKLKKLMGAVSAEVRALLESAPPQVKLLVETFLAASWQLDSVPIKGESRLQFSRNSMRQIAILRWRNRSCAACTDMLGVVTQPARSVHETSGFLVDLAKAAGVADPKTRKMICPPESSFAGALHLEIDEHILRVELFRKNGH